MISINSNDFLNKELVKSLSYTTATQDREAYCNVVINGRNYIKTGTLQAVTVVCNVYKIYNSKTKNYEYWAHFGMSRQHPNDSNVNKELGYEIAQNQLLNDPFWIMKVEKDFNEHAFRDMARVYVDNMNLEFIKTHAEIKNTQNN